MNVNVKREKFIQSWQSYFGLMCSLHYSHLWYIFVLDIKWHCGFCFKIQFSWFLPSIVIEGIKISSAGQKHSHFKDPVEMLQEENNPRKKKSLYKIHRSSINNFIYCRLCLGKHPFVWHCYFQWVYWDKIYNPHLELWKHDWFKWNWSRWQDFSSYVYLSPLLSELSAVN